MLDGIYQSISIAGLRYGKVMQCVKVKIGEGDEELVGTHTQVTTKAIKKRKEHLK